MGFDETTAERVRQLLAGRQDVVEKRMMGGLCFMVRGGMCCCISGTGGILVRVGATAYDSVLNEPHVQPMKMGRRVMRGFVRVAPAAYLSRAQLRRWVFRGVDYVESLPSKPMRNHSGSHPKSKRRRLTK